MRIVTLLLFLVLSFFAQCRDIDNFINITKPGVYDFQHETIYVKDRANIPAIVIGDAENQNPTFIVENVTVKNVIIFGRMHAQDSEYNTTFPYLRNNGITIRGARNVSLENVWVISARSGGLVVEKHSSNVSVTDSYFIANYFDGIAACETSNSAFERITVAYNRYAGISLDWFVRDCIFRGVYSCGNHDWTVFQRLSTNIGYDLMLSENNGGGIYLAPNLDSSERTPSTAWLRLAVFADLRDHSVAVCCELITRPE